MNIAVSGPQNVFILEMLQVLPQRAMLISGGHVTIGDIEWNSEESIKINFRAIKWNGDETQRIKRDGSRSRSSRSFITFIFLVSGSPPPD